VVQTDSAHRAVLARAWDAQAVHRVIDRNSCAACAFDETHLNPLTVAAKNCENSNRRVHS
jgi:hypothetical protein